MDDWIRTVTANEPSSTSRSSIPDTYVRLMSVAWNDTGRSDGDPRNAWVYLNDGGSGTATTSAAAVDSVDDFIASAPSMVDASPVGGAARRSNANLNASGDSSRVGFEPGTCVGAPSASSPRGQLW